MTTKETQKFDFEKLPSMLASYRRALLGFYKSRSGHQDLPRIEAFVSDVSVDSERLSFYREVCSLAESVSLPPAYPQVLAAPLHAAMLTGSQFPLRALGLIHVANRIVEHRVIYENERLDFECVIDGYQETLKGLAFELTTRAASGDEIVWESTATLLAKEGKSKPAALAPAPAARSARMTPSARVRLWNIPAQMGRRYASAAGDYNPIHLHAMTALFFGLKQPIAHWMWTLARSLGEIDAEMPRCPRVIEVSFQKPIPLPSVALFSSVRDRAGLQFSLRTTDGSVTFLQGNVARTAHADDGKN